MTSNTPSHDIVKNEEIEVSVRRKPSCRVELTVKVFPPIIDQARKAAIKTISKEVAIPGFRKGKAPEETILKRYPQEVEKQLHKTLADLSYTAAQKLVHIPLLNNNAQITFDLKNHSDKEAELVFSFETEPLIPTVDPQLFVRKSVERAEVTDKQIDEAIRQMMFFYADWNPIENRSIQDGDYITIDLDTIEDEGAPQRVFNHVRFEVSKERMASWMKRLVEGAKAGDVLEGISESDDTASEEEKNTFKPKKVRVSILKAEEVSLPELNDEFSKKVGAETVEKMRESVAAMLNHRADDGVKEALGEQVSDFLVENYAFDLPASLIAAETKHRKEQLLKDPAFRKNWDHHMTPAEKEAREETISIESGHAIRLFYLARAVVHQANIPITQQEVQHEAISTMHSFGHRGVHPEKIPRKCP